MADPYLYDPMEEPSQPYAPEPTGPPQQAQFQPPEVVEPWTQNDTLELQRYNQAIAGLKQQAQDRTLHPAEAAFEAAKLERERAPLIARQKQAQMRELAEQQQMALHQAASVKSIQLQDQQADANNFQIKTVADPETGRPMSFFQHEPGKWTKIDAPEAAVPAADQMHGYIPPEATANPDGTHTMTIYNGAQRSDTNYRFDPQSNSWQTTGRQDYDAAGRPVTQEQAALQEDADWQQAKRMIGGREPPEYIAGPGNRPVANPAHGRYQDAVREAFGRIQNARTAQVKAEAARVEKVFSDALTTHPLKNYSDAADPHAARMDAVMGDFARLHPNDPRVRDWQAQKDQMESALARRDPKTMSLNELATATVGAHANTQRMIEKEEAEIKKDEREIPEGTTGKATGIGYSPAGGAKGPFKAMDPEDIHAEAVSRVRSRLTQQLMDARKAKGGPAAEPTVSNETVEGGKTPGQSETFTTQEADEMARLRARKRQFVQQRAGAAGPPSLPMPDVDPTTGTRSLSRFR